HTKVAEDRLHAEGSDASRRHLAAPGKEVTHAVIEMCLDHPVGGVVRAGTEVTTPSPHQSVQRVAYLPPCTHVPRHQDRAHPVLQTLHALLRWTGTREPSAGLAEAVRAEAVTQEVEPFLPCIAQTGFRPVQGQPQTRHHTIRPRQRLGRMAPAEDDEVVCVVDDMRLPGLASAALTPVFQETIHVEIGDQWTDHASLGCAMFVGFPAFHAPLAIPVGGFHWRL